MRSWSAFARHSCLIALLAAPAASQELDLRTLLGHFASSRGVEAEFREEKELPLLARPLVSEGVLYFVPHGRLARFTRTPEAASLLVDGARLRIEDSLGVEELDLGAHPEARQFVDQLLLLFNGDEKGLARSYETRFAVDDEGWSLVLTPRGLRMRQVIREISLRGNARKLEEMVVSGAEGERTRTTFGATRVDRPFREDEIAKLFPPVGSPVPLEAP